MASEGSGLVLVEVVEHIAELSKLLGADVAVLAKEDLKRAFADEHFGDLNIQKGKKQFRFAESVSHRK